jgi:trehalose synthase
MATDDHEAGSSSRKTFSTRPDPDIKILNNLNNVGAIEVNAFQSQSDVLLQIDPRGLRVDGHRGCGRCALSLPATWRHPLQISDGESGFLVNTPHEAAERSLEILSDPALGKFLGRKGKEHVRAHFLTPRLLRDWLEMFTDLEV